MIFSCFSRKKTAPAPRNIRGERKNSKSRTWVRQFVYRSFPDSDLLFEITEELVMIMKFLLYYFGILFGLKALGIGEEKNDPKENGK